MKSYTFLPCVACGDTVGVRGHHIKTQKAHPELKNEPRNIMPLCFNHHVEIHFIGLNDMSLRYYDVMVFLENNGWYFNEGLNKYVLGKEALY